MIMENKECRTVNEFKVAVSGTLYTRYISCIKRENYEYAMGLLSGLFLTRKINMKLYDLLFAYMETKQFKRPRDMEEIREHYKETLGRV